MEAGVHAVQGIGGKGRRVAVLHEHEPGHLRLVGVAARLEVVGAPLTVRLGPGVNTKVERAL